MKLRVIVADDETPICEWLVYCIHRASENYEVLSARTGDEAYSLILEHKPDLVFTDIRMPGLDGLELMRRVLEVLLFTVFAILTNYAEFSYARQAISLGAREYFLKSELRASDIEALLSSVKESKETIVAQKMLDVLPSGCIDLYNLYQNQEQPGYADRFWAGQGMADRVPYLLLCVPGGKSQGDWRRRVSLSQEIKAKLGQDLYIAVASEKEYEYIVVQTDQQLLERTKTAVNYFQELGGIGVSTAANRREEFPRLAKEAACALKSLFFAAQESTAYFSTLESRQPLDRENLRTRKQELISLIAQRRYDEAFRGFQAWFAVFEQPAAGDIDWAMDDCRRMVLAVEELCCQSGDAAVQQMEIQNTLSQCVSRCLALIDKVKSVYAAKCSPSIERALEYIHCHYQEEISMAEVARKVYRSPEYFSRQFKEEVGENFSVYLTLYRLDRARELLQGTDLRIAEIAERVGYITPGYFSRIYKKYRGITPEQERGSNL